MNEFGSGGVFVLGGSGELGSAICRMFAQRGVPVAFSYNTNALAAGALAEEIARQGVDVASYQLNAAHFEAVATVLGAAADQLGGLHSIVYAGGPPFTPEFFSRVESSTWQTWLEQDILAAIHLARAGLPHLRASRGAFAALSTYQANQIEVRGGVSAIAKGAIDRMIAVIAKEEGRYGVRANALRCGWIRTETNHKLFSALPQIAEKKHNSIPLGRLGDPDEVAEAVVFLCSRRAGFITGTTLTVDGGESL